MKKELTILLLGIFIAALIPKNTGASTSHSVPNFTQAPTGNWADPRQKYGCEEASILMALSWATGRGFSAEDLETEIRGMADFEEKAMLGFHHDTSAADTAKLMQEYYGYANVTLAENVTTADLKNRLAGGAILLVPVDLSKFGKKYYKIPVARHMIVVKGFDESSGEFLVNDPMFWQEKRVAESALAKALRDYPSGINRKVTTTKTAMVVVMR